jgi:hypothetical protein
MATKKQKEDLIELLKFTPRTYKIYMYGYGGEVYIGTVDRKVYDYFVDNNLDIEEYANDWDGELGVPEEFQPFSPGQKYDCDNIVHASGVEMSASCQIVVEDENSKEVWTSTLDLDALDDQDIEWDCW